MDRTQELTAAGATAGLIDPDLLKVAKPDLPPEDAMCDLVRRFPGAFRADQSSKFEQAVEAKRPKQFKDMTPKEQEAFRRRHSMPGERISVLQGFPQNLRRL